MTRTELAQRLALKFPQLSYTDSDISVKSILEALTSCLAKGSRVEVRGFGAFTLNIRRPRLGRNPKTGEKVQVPEKCAVHFKPGIELKERVNQQ